MRMRLQTWRRASVPCLRPCRRSSDPTHCGCNREVTFPLPADSDQLLLATPGLDALVLCTLCTGDWASSTASQMNLNHAIGWAPFRSIVSLFPIGSSATNKYRRPLGPRTRLDQAGQDTLQNNSFACRLHRPRAHTHTPVSWVWEGCFGITSGWDGTREPECV